MDEKKSKSDAVSQKKESSEFSGKAAVFSLEKLERNCKEIFGVTSGVFRGVAYSLNKDKKYTVDEVKAAIEKWRKIPIQMKEGVK